MGIMLYFGNVKQGKYLKNKYLKISQKTKQEIQQNFYIPNYI